MACVRIEQQELKKDLYKEATAKEVETTRYGRKPLLWESQTGNRFRCIDSLETRPQEDETDEAYAQVYRNGGKGSTKLRQRGRLVAVCRAQSTTTGAVATRPNSSVVRLQHKKLAKKRRTASINGGVNRPPAQMPRPASARKMQRQLAMLWIAERSEIAAA